MTTSTSIFLVGFLEAEQFEALNAKEDPVGTAQELDRLRVSLSTSAHRWRDHRVEGLRLDDAWVSTARTGKWA